MKVYSLFLGLLMVAFLSSCDCHKKEDCLSQHATVIKDCTSSYLRVDNKDYLICNEERVESYSNNSSVHATFQRKEGCSYTGDCYLHHSYEYSIEILNIQ